MDGLGADGIGLAQPLHRQKRFLHGCKGIGQS
jgi:hypothetical protein